MTRRCQPCLLLQRAMQSPHNNTVSECCSLLYIGIVRCKYVPKHFGHHLPEHLGQPTVVFTQCCYTRCLSGVLLTPHALKQQITITRGRGDGHFFTLFTDVRLKQIGSKHMPHLTMCSESIHMMLNSQSSARLTLNVQQDQESKPTTQLVADITPYY